MPSEEHYDDSAFLYFALSVLTIIIIPTTFAYVKIWKNALDSKYTGLCGCEACRTKAANLRKASRKPSLWGLTKFAIYVGCIALFFFLLVKASESGTTSTAAFDPYQTLELDQGASEEEIKKAYRKLSLKWHPDKSDDPEAPERFIQIAKAHKTLTDADTREKWEKYGNPDGPQGFSVGIALPSFLVDSQNSLLILAIYVVGLVIIFPTVVICFWNRQKELTPNQLNRKTMQYYWSAISEHMRFKKLITVMCLSYEYMTKITLRRSDEITLKKLKLLLPEPEKQKAPSKNPKPGKKQKMVTPPHAIKNTLLLFTHFSRLSHELDDQQRKDLQILLKDGHLVIGGLVEISMARRWIVPMIESIQISQMITQSCWSDASRMGISTTLLQLPHFTEKMVDKLSTKKYKISNISQYLDLPRDLRLEFLLGEGLSEVQITDIERVGASLPKDVEFSWKVQVDEEDEKLGITAGSIVNLLVEFTRPSKLGGKPAPSLEEEMSNKGQIKEIPTDTIDVHCPYFPAEKKEYWWLILSDQAGLLINLKKVNALRNGTGIRIPFQAPKKPGVYNYTLNLVCDSYCGFDKTVNFKVKVDKELKEEKLIEEEEDLSDEEETPKIEDGKDTDSESDSDSDSD